MWRKHKVRLEGPYKNWIYKFFWYTVKLFKTEIMIERDLNWTLLLKAHTGTTIVYNTSLLLKLMTQLGFKRFQTRGCCCWHVEEEGELVWIDKSMTRCTCCALSQSPNLQTECLTGSLPGPSGLAHPPPATSVGNITATIRWVVAPK